MPRQGTSLLIAVWLVLLVANVSFAGKALLEDKFSTLNPAWPAEGQYASVKDGQLILAPPPNNSSFLLHAGFLPYDADISATMTYTKAGDMEDVAGICFWATSLDAFYQLWYLPDGTFGVTRLTQGRWLIPVAKRPFDGIKKGLNQANLLRIVTKGNSVTIYFNGKKALTFTAQAPQPAQLPAAGPFAIPSPLNGQMVGLFCYSGPNGNIVTFANFKVTAP